MAFFIPLVRFLIWTGLSRYLFFSYASRGRLTAPGGKFVRNVCLGLFSLRGSGSQEELESRAKGRVALLEGAILDSTYIQAIC